MANCVLGFKLISRYIQGFYKDEKNNVYEWRSIVPIILDKGQDIEEILVNLTANINPMSWSGSRAVIMQERPNADA